METDLNCSNFVARRDGWSRPLPLGVPRPMSFELKILRDTVYFTDPIKAKNTKDNHQVDYLRTLPLHHSQKEVKRHNEYSIFEVKLSPSYDFIQEILSKGEEVEILSPEWFRDEMAGYVRSLYNMYKDSIANLDKRDAEEKSKK